MNYMHMHMNAALVYYFVLCMYIYVYVPGICGLRELLVKISGVISTL